MGNRMEDQAVCVKCGGPLIDPKAVLKMCSKCEKWAQERTIELIAKRKERKGAPTRLVINRGRFKT